MANSNENLTLTIGDLITDSNLNLGLKAQDVGISHFTNFNKMLSGKHENKLSDYLHIIDKAPDTYAGNPVLNNDNLPMSSVAVDDLLFIGSPHASSIESFSQTKSTNLLVPTVAGTVTYNTDGGSGAGGETVTETTYCLNGGFLINDVPNPTQTQNTINSRVGETTLYSLTGISESYYTSLATNAVSQEEFEESLDLNHSFIKVGLNASTTGLEYNLSFGGFVDFADWWTYVPNFDNTKWYMIRVPELDQDGFSLNRTRYTIGLGISVHNAIDATVAHPTTGQQVPVFFWQSGMTIGALPTDHFSPNTHIGPAVLGITVDPTSATAKEFSSTLPVGASHAPGNSNVFMSTDFSATIEFYKYNPVYGHGKVHIFKRKNGVTSPRAVGTQGNKLFSSNHNLSDGDIVRVEQALSADADSLQPRAFLKDEYEVKVDNSESFWLYDKDTSEIVDLNIREGDTVIWTCTQGANGSWEGAYKHIYEISSPMGKNGHGFTWEDASRTDNSGSTNDKLVYAIEPSSTNLPPKNKTISKSDSYSDDFIGYSSQNDLEWLKHRGYPNVGCTSLAFASFVNGPTSFLPYKADVAAGNRFGFAIDAIRIPKEEFVGLDSLITTNDYEGVHKYSTSHPGDNTGQKGQFYALTVTEPGMHKHYAYNENLADLSMGSKSEDGKLKLLPDVQPNGKLYTFMVRVKEDGSVEISYGGRKEVPTPYAPSLWKNTAEGSNSFIHGVVNNLWTGQPSELEIIKTNHNGRFNLGPINGVSSLHTLVHDPYHDSSGTEVQMSLDSQEFPFTGDIDLTVEENEGDAFPAKTDHSSVLLDIDSWYSASDPNSSNQLDQEFQNQPNNWFEKYYSVKPNLMYLDNRITRRHVGCISVDDLVEQQERIDNNDKSYLVPNIWKKFSNAIDDYTPEYYSGNPSLVQDFDSNQFGGVTYNNKFWKDFKRVVKTCDMYWFEATQTQFLDINNYHTDSNYITNKRPLDSQFLFTENAFTSVKTRFLLDGQIPKILILTNNNVTKNSHYEDLGFRNSQGDFVGPERMRRWSDEEMGQSLCSLYSAYIEWPIDSVGQTNIVPTLELNSIVYKEDKQSSTNGSINYNYRFNAECRFYTPAKFHHPTPVDLQHAAGFDGFGHRNLDKYVTYLFGSSFEFGKSGKGGDIFVSEHNFSMDGDNTKLDEFELFAGNSGHPGDTEAHDFLNFANSGLLGWGMVHRLRASSRAGWEFYRDHENSLLYLTAAAVKNFVYTDLDEHSNEQSGSLIGNFISDLGSSVGSAEVNWLSNNNNFARRGFGSYLAYDPACDVLLVGAEADPFNEQNVLIDTAPNEFLKTNNCAPTIFLYERGKNTKSSEVLSAFNLTQKLTMTMKTPVSSKRRPFGNRSLDGNVGADYTTAYTNPKSSSDTIFQDRYPEMPYSIDIKDGIITASFGTASALWNKNGGQESKFSSITNQQLIKSAEYTEIVDFTTIDAITNNKTVEWKHSDQFTTSDFINGLHQNASYSGVSLSDAKSIALVKHFSIPSSNLEDGYVNLESLRLALTSNDFVNGSSIDFNITFLYQHASYNPQGTSLPLDDTYYLGTASFNTSNGIFSNTTNTIQLEDYFDLKSLMVSPEFLDRSSDVSAGRRTSVPNSLGTLLMAISVVTPQSDKHNTYKTSDVGSLPISFEVVDAKMFVTLSTKPFGEYIGVDWYNFDRTDNYYEPEFAAISFTNLSGYYSLSAYADTNPSLRGTYSKAYSITTDSALFSPHKPEYLPLATSGSEIANGGLTLKHHGAATYDDSNNDTKMGLFTFSLEQQAGDMSLVVGPPTSDQGMTLLYANVYGVNQGDMVLHRPIMKGTDFNLDGVTNAPLIIKAPDFNNDMSLVTKAPEAANANAPLVTSGPISANGEMILTGSVGHFSYDGFLGLIVSGMEDFNNNMTLHVGVESDNQGMSLVQSSPEPTNNNMSLITQASFTAAMPLLVERIGSFAATTKLAIFDTNEAEALTLAMNALNQTEFETTDPFTLHVEYNPTLANSIDDAAKASRVVGLPQGVFDISDDAEAPRPSGKNSIGHKNVSISSRSFGKAAHNARPMGTGTYGFSSAYPLNSDTHKAINAGLESQFGPRWSSTPIGHNYGMTYGSDGFRSRNMVRQAFKYTLASSDLISDIGDKLFVGGGSISKITRKDNAKANVQGTKSIANGGNWPQKSPIKIEVFDKTADKQVEKLLDLDFSNAIDNIINDNSGFVLGESGFRHILRESLHSMGAYQDFGSFFSITPMSTGIFDTKQLMIEIKDIAIAERIDHVTKLNPFNSEVESGQFKWSPIYDNDENPLFPLTADYEINNAYGVNSNYFTADGDHTAQESAAWADYLEDNLHSASQLCAISVDFVMSSLQEDTLSRACNAILVFDIGSVLLYNEKHEKYNWSGSKKQISENDLMYFLSPNTSTLQSSTNYEHTGWGLSSLAWHRNDVPRTSGNYDGGIEFNLISDYHLNKNRDFFLPSDQQIQIIYSNVWFPAKHGEFKKPSQWQFTNSTSLFDNNGQLEASLSLPKKRYNGTWKYSPMSAPLNNSEVSGITGYDLDGFFSTTHDWPKHVDSYALRRPANHSLDCVDKNRTGTRPDTAAGPPRKIDITTPFVIEPWNEYEWDVFSSEFSGWGSTTSPSSATDRNIIQPSNEAGFFGALSKTNGESKAPFHNHIQKILIEGDFMFVAIPTAMATIEYHNHWDNVFDSIFKPERYLAPVCHGKVMIYKFDRTDTRFDKTGFWKLVDTVYAKGKTRSEMLALSDSDFRDNYPSCLRNNNIDSTAFFHDFFGFDIDYKNGKLIVGAPGEPASNIDIEETFLGRLGNFAVNVYETNAVIPHAGATYEFDINQTTGAATLSRATKAQDFFSDFPSLGSDITGVTEEQRKWWGLEFGREVKLSSDSSYCMSGYWTENSSYVNSPTPTGGIDVTLGSLHDIGRNITETINNDNINEAKNYYDDVNWGLKNDSSFYSGYANDSINLMNLFSGISVVNFDGKDEILATSSLALFTRNFQADWPIEIHKIAKMGETVVDQFTLYIQAPDTNTGELNLAMPKTAGLLNQQLDLRQAGHIASNGSMSLYLHQRTPVNQGMPLNVNMPVEDGYFPLFIDVQGDDVVANATLVTAGPRLQNSGGWNPAGKFEISSGTGTSYNISQTYYDENHGIVMQRGRKYNVIADNIGGFMDEITFYSDSGFTNIWDKMVDNSSISRNDTAVFTLPLTTEDLDKQLGTEEYTNPYTGVVETAHVFYFKNSIIDKNGKGYIVAPFNDFGMTLLVDCDSLVDNQDIKLSLPFVAEIGQGTETMVSSFPMLIKQDDRVPTADNGSTALVTVASPAGIPAAFKSMNLVAGNGVTGLEESNFPMYLKTIEKGNSSANIPIIVYNPIETGVAFAPAPLIVGAPTTGLQEQKISTIPLAIHNENSYNNNIPLVLYRKGISGGEEKVGDTTLLIHNESTSGNMSLVFGSGDMTSSGNMTTIIEGFTWPSGITPLMTRGYNV